MLPTCQRCLVYWKTTSKKNTLEMGKFPRTHPLFQKNGGPSPARENIKDPRPGGHLSFVRSGDSCRFQPHGLVTERTLELGRVRDVEVCYQELVFLHETWTCFRGPAFLASVAKIGVHGLRANEGEISLVLDHVGLEVEQESATVCGIVQRALPWKRLDLCRSSHCADAPDRTCPGRVCSCCA